MAASWVVFGYLVAYGALAFYAGLHVYRLRRLHRERPPET